MKKYQAMILTCSLCSLAAAPAFGQVTTGSGATNPGAPSQQAPAGGARPDSATDSTRPPGTAAPGTPTDDKSTLGRQDTRSSDSKIKGSGMKDSSVKGPAGSGMTGSGMSGGSHQNASADQVRQIQEALKAQGQNPGPIDGVMGARTQGALRAYQGSNNLTATGQLDPSTMEKLGVGGSTGGKPQLR